MEHKIDISVRPHCRATRWASEINLLGITGYKNTLWEAMVCIALMVDNAFFPSRRTVLAT